ncbi:MAG: hypothetical protein K2P81_10345 [Bacteriovoracaceae bacterium]|nr:hypothetical protein [Bacteriovoracaceae bacterium]
MNAIVQSLDFCRVSLLRLTLRPRFFRTLYAQAHTRLAVGMLLVTALFLPIAFLKPEILLAFGPLIFGYPHLISSYRFTPELKNFALFLFMTAVAVALHLSHVGAPLPFGVWQIVVATVTLMISRKGQWSAILVCAALVKLAWMEPLIFVGGSLLLHNWVAFFYWIKVSRNSARRTVAILATLLFLAIHLLVLMGNFDGWIPLNNGNVHFAGNAQNTAWMLASWSNDVIVWYRFLVLYVFGLSVHYFVWLRAIPESRKVGEHPSSFRLIYQDLKASIGEKVFLFTLALSAGGIVLWLISLPLGAQVYFEIAILHGSLELMFLLPKKFNNVRFIK